MITLYDIPSTIAGQAWSPTVWQVRYALNLKRLPYKTVWVEYPDIEATCKSHGIPATDINDETDNSPLYTLPFIHDSTNNTYVVDSLDIIRYLDKTYPNDGPIFLSAQTERLQRIFWKQVLKIHAIHRTHFISLPIVAERLNERSREYFVRARTATLLVDNFLDAFPARNSEKWAEEWKAIEEGFSAIATFYSNAYSGSQDRYKPVVEGEVLFLLGNGRESACWADLRIISMLTTIKSVYGEESEQWKDIARWNGGLWGRLAEALADFKATH